MTVIETKVSVKKSNGAVVSADVHLYDDVGDLVKTVNIVESEALQALEDSIEGFREAYVSREALDVILENVGETVPINATRIRGLESDEIALKSEIPVTFDPISHDSASNKYGLGSTSRYGHVKTRNDLNSAVYSSGEALSGYQGKVLNDKILNLQNSVSNAVSDSIVGSGSISANKNGCTGTIKYVAVDFGSKIGVFVGVWGLYMSTSGKNTSTYYHLYDGTVFPVGLRPSVNENHVCAGMGNHMRVIQVCSDGTMKFRLLNMDNGSFNNAIYTHFHYFINK